MNPLARSIAGSCLLLAAASGQSCGGGDSDGTAGPAGGVVGTGASSGGKPSTGGSGGSGGSLLIDASPPSDGPPPDGKPVAVNLIPNGDFTQGNTLFGSDYAYATTNTMEGQYTVGTNAQAFNGLLVTAGDHTTGSGLMFIGNGKATPDRVWFTTSPIAVQPNTNYYFEAFVMNLCCASGLGNGVDPVGPSELSFYANDQPLGTRTSSKLGVWEGLTTSWSSGSATSVTLKLVNANTVAAGNDFAADDIYLGIVSTVQPPK
ncbi:MAG: hypothetical protein IPI67_25945 [Myxococcales bacterium]|nr:hypothetical protein [Myxococcales bacterium]